jgi:hypothetical protein
MEWEMREKEGSGVGGKKGKRHRRTCVSVCICVCMPVRRGDRGDRASPIGGMFTRRKMKHDL